MYSYAREVKSLRFGLVLAIAMSASTSLTQAQTFTVIHDFTGGVDGGSPSAGVTIDNAGKIYGTALSGGTGSCSPYDNGCGVVFQMKRSGSGWLFTPLYNFRGGSDGAEPYSRVLFGPGGALYGTTVGGGVSTCIQGCGTVYTLRPPLSVCKSALCYWSEAVLYRFNGRPDGYYPAGDLTFDRSGNIYGTTTQGGSAGPGTVWELSHSGGGWSEAVLYSLRGQDDGGNPYSGVVFDSGGNLYGTSSAGGTYFYGAVWQLSLSGSSWNETTLYDFQGASDGGVAYPGLVIDNSGNLYGATTQTGSYNGGTVYEISPEGGGWHFALLEELPGSGSSGPFASLSRDAAGNLYGTTQGDPSSGNYGTVFKLTYSGGSWTYTLLHQFTGADGANPYSNVSFDASGNLYGTTLQGGTHNQGVVWEITP